MCPFIRSCLAAAVFALFASNAHALSGPACNVYAHQATEMAKIASELGCGFGDHPRWGNNREGHTRWCRAANQASVDFEASERNAAIAKCKVCRGYKDDAEFQARLNLLYHCEGSGPRWGFGDGHMIWCMAQSPDARVAEANARENEVLQCVGKFKPGDFQACFAYADNAVKQAKFNRELPQCNTPGPRFSDDHDQHVAWCLRHAEVDSARMAALTKEESDARDAENKTCQDNTVEYGDCAGCNRPAGELWPEQSPGPSPFGAADKLEKGPSLAPKGGANLNKRLGEQPRVKPDTTRAKVSPAKQKTGANAGFSTTTPTPASGQNAMDRLGGAPVAAAPGGGSSTAKPGGTTAQPNKSGATGAAAGGPSGGFNTAKPNTAPLLPTMALPPPRSKSGM